MSRKRKDGKPSGGVSPMRQALTPPPVIRAAGPICKALLATASYQVVSLFLGATDLHAAADLPGLSADTHGAQPVQLACIGCTSGPDNIRGECVGGGGGCSCTGCTGCQECKRCVDCTGCTGCVSLTTNESKSAHHYRIGLAFENDRNWAAAEQSFRTALGFYPNWATYHNHLAYVLAQQDRHAEAAEEYKETIRISPSESGAYTNLAILLFNRLDRKDEAESWLDRALRVDPGNEPARKMLVEALGIRRSATVEPLYDAAYAFQEKGEFGKAEALYRKYLALDPKYPASAWNHLGFVLANQGRHLAAEAAYRRAAGIDPSDDIAADLKSHVASPARNRALAEALAAKEQGQIAKGLADDFRIEAAKGQSMVCFDDARGCAYTKDHATEALVYAPVPTPRKPPAPPPEAVRKDPELVRLTAGKEAAEKAYGESYDLLRELWEKRDAAKGAERGTVEVKLAEVRNRMTELKSEQRVRELEIRKVYRNHGVKMEDL